MIEPTMLVAMKQILTLGLLAILVCAGCDRDKPSQPDQQPVGSNPLNAPTDYLGAMGKAKKHSEKTIELAALNQAIQLFYAQEDRYPKNLEELVSSRTIGALPKPPVGLKFSYNPTNGEIKLVTQ